MSQSYDYFQTRFAPRLPKEASNIKVAGISLDRLLPPGANVDYVAEMATGSKGGTWNMMKFELYRAVMNSVLYAVDIYYSYFPLIWKDMLVRYVELPEHKRQMRMTVKCADNLISTYFTASRERSTFDEGMKLSHAIKALASIRQHKGSQGLPVHVSTIVSYKAPPSNALPLSPAEMKLADGTVVHPASDTLKVYERAKKAENDFKMEHESREIARILSDTIDFIWWSLKFGMEFVTVHEALGKLVLHQTEIASLLSERLNSTTERIRLYFPATNSCIIVTADSWEQFNTEWASTGGNEHDYDGLTAVILKVGDGYASPLQKNFDFLEGTIGIREGVVPRHFESVSADRVIEFAKEACTKSSDGDPPLQEDLFHSLIKTTTGLSVAPQLLILFGSQEFIEGYPMYLLSETVLCSSKFHFGSEQRSPTIVEYLTALIEYSKGIEREAE